MYHNSWLCVSIHQWRYSLFGNNWSDTPKCVIITIFINCVCVNMKRPVILVYNIGANLTRTYLKCHLISAYLTWLNFQMCWHPLDLFCSVTEWVIICKFQRFLKNTNVLQLVFKCKMLLSNDKCQMTNVKCQMSNVKCQVRSGQISRSCEISVYLVRSLYFLWDLCRSCGISVMLVRSQ